MSYSSDFSISAIGSAEELQEVNDILRPAIEGVKDIQRRAITDRDGSYGGWFLRAASIFPELQGQSLVLFGQSADDCLRLNLAPLEFDHETEKQCELAVQMGIDLFGDSWPWREFETTKFSRWLATRKLGLGLNVGELVFHGLYDSASPLRVVVALSQRFPGIVFTCELWTVYDIRATFTASDGALQALEYVESWHNEAVDVLLVQNGEELDPPEYIEHGDGYGYDY